MLMPIPYLSLDELLEQVDEPYRIGCQTLLADNRELFESVRGSTHNHQAWSGGFIDHLHEVMNLAVILYETLKDYRPLPFSVSDVLLTLFAHDLEKPWAYVQLEGTWRRHKRFQSKEEAHAFRLEKLKEYGIELPAEIERSIFFTEGELSYYSNRERAMSPLAAFCHMCDVASARLWYDYPLDREDSWVGAKRFRIEICR
jgi:hypothetical protein